ncbi:hypothetical protein N1028_18985 [Herbiconiux sp. CPCC 203407]|uniref:Uncharacterized protein n=1 Tax=Herbiconiux oxytropis TaxID=2970915 RepID=A0AA41XGY0_9MICO|nr:hypothetical protein [Herbiconiux oxytropis]MCS5727989.1 hypothetical protein [Herbiconiux oxytropis]
MLPLAIGVAVSPITIIAGPVVGFLLATRRMTGPLRELRAWLEHNTATTPSFRVRRLGP